MYKQNYKKLIQFLTWFSHVIIDNIVLIRNNHSKHRGEYECMVNTILAVFLNNSSFYKTFFFLIMTSFEPREWLGFRSSREEAIWFNEKKINWKRRKKYTDIQYIKYDIVYIQYTDNQTCKMTDNRDYVLLPFKLDLIFWFAIILSLLYDCRVLTVDLCDVHDFDTYTEQSVFVTCENAAINLCTALTEILPWLNNTGYCTTAHNSLLSEGLGFVLCSWLVSWSRG